jgi:magnesium chelatase accessory protein
MLRTPTAMWHKLYTPLSWDTHSPTWPNHAHSQFVQTNHYRWHVQVMGQGPVMLMLHGTGASAHTWAGMSETLQAHYTLVCPDLPGHGFTTALHDDDYGLHSMTLALTDLLQQMAYTPQVVVGHSAGAAVGMDYVMQHNNPAALSLVGLNPAWLPLPGLAQWLFPVAAKLAALNPLSGWLTSKQASMNRVRQLLASTGSQLTAQQLAPYAVLMQSPHHVQGVLRMMSQWQLDDLVQRFVERPSRLLIQVGSADRTIPMHHALQVQQLLPQSTLQVLDGLGHLAHEENAALSAQQLLSWLSLQTGH